MIRYVQIERSGVANLRPREIAYAASQSLAAGILFWHATFRQFHFTPQAVVRYGLSPRTRVYQLKKARAKHHQRALTWSGDTEAMTRGIQVRAVKTHPMAQGVMPAPAYFGYRKADRDMHAELTVVIPGEAAQIAARVREEFYRRITRAGGRIVVRLSA